MFRRKRLPADLRPVFEAFLAVVDGVERAKAVLTQAMPTGRLPGRPVADVVLEFEEGLREAAAHMEAWRDPRLQGEWSACRQGVEEALTRVERLRLEAPDPGGVEGLIGLIEGLLDPLDPFEAAVERFRRLRT